MPIKTVLKTVLYVSKAQGLRAKRQLQTLIPLARLANKTQGITSVLKFNGRHYTQVIEGPTKAVDALMARIAMDARHSQLRVLCDARRTDRSYVGLPMTYLYDERFRGLTTELVDGKRVLSGIELHEVFLSAPPPMTAG